MLCLFFFRGLTGLPLEPFLLSLGVGTVCVWYVVVFGVEGGYKSCFWGKNTGGMCDIFWVFFGEVVVGRDGNVSFYSCIICDLQMCVGNIVSNILVCHSEHAEHLKHPR